jgi:hypothetical protein
MHTGMYIHIYTLTCISEGRLGAKQGFKRARNDVDDEPDPNAGREDRDGEDEYEQTDDVDMYDKTIEDRRKAVAAENKRQKYSNPVSLLCMYRINIQIHIQMHVHVHIHVFVCVCLGGRV